MKIKWFGHSCFLLTSNNGIRVLTDPFDEKVGYPLPKIEADIVTTSHEHFDHYNTAVAGENFDHIKNPGTYAYRDVEIRGIKTFHDNKGGTQRGKNTIFIYSMDGITLCHLGDLGHTLSQEQIREIGSVDVLLIPVGSVYTIDSTAAIEVIKSLNPKISIPMHYKTGHLSFGLETSDSFLEQMSGKKLNENEITINSNNLSVYPSVIALSYL